MNLLRDLIGVYILLLFAYGLLSWLPTRGPNGSGIASVQHALGILCEPVLGLVRRIMPRSAVGGVDFSLLVAMLILYVVKQII